MSLESILNSSALDFFRENSFSEVESSEQKAVYTNGKCELLFVREYADVYLSIKPSASEDESFHIGTIIYLLCGKTVEMFSDFEDPAKRPLLQVQNYIRYLKGPLSDILQGDFSWSENYHAHLNEQKWFRQELHKLPRKHPIWEKYLANDNSWQDDLRKLNS